MRLPNWPERFAALVDERRHAEFAWGLNDCATFAADTVVALTGEDVAPDGLALWETAAQAARVQLSMGGLAQIATDALGVSTGPQWAAVGDIVLLEMDGRQSLAVCNGTVALAPGPVGLALADMSTALCCWKVG